MDWFQLPQGYSHFQEAVYFLPSIYNSFASWFLISKDFSLPHIPHFDNIIALPLLLLEISVSMFSVFFYTLSNMIPFYTYYFKMHSTMLSIVQKYFKILSSFLLKLFGEKGFVYSIKVFAASIKSIKPIQKYPHITESYACILKF